MRTFHSLRTLLLLLPLAITLHAQPPATPPQTNTPQDVLLNPTLPTLFIVGDSTARNGADLGWGDHFAPLFDTSKINIANRAMAGRSSRSYYNEGHWDKVLSEMKPGDYVLIQMGHNDGGSGPEAVAKDTKYRSSIKGLGDETVDVPLPKPFTTGPIANQTTETVHTYGWYIRKYISDTRAKHATPILLTVTIRNIWTTGPGGKPHIERDMGFRDFEYQLGIAEHVPVVDMATVAADGFEALGPEKTALLFPIDHTHTSAIGADMNAHSVATALRNAKSPLAMFLRTDAGIKDSATKHATGGFDVKLVPQTADPAGGEGIGRMLFDKQFHGALEASSKGQMLASGTGAPGSSGAYVALEAVTGSLEGKKGTFVLMHSATMTQGVPALSVTVVPGSGTSELAGLAGKMDILIADGKHSYVFDYTLPE
jgi:rhamnogalacturonan acetylesterase